MQNNMETYEQQTLPFGETVSTCLPADSPASRSASRASAKARRTTATSGRRCCGLFGLFDPVGSWARTFSELLIGRKEWSSTRCVLTWKRQDTKCSRTLYRLAVSALPTGGTDAGLLPTVQTQGLKQCENGKTVFMPLELLPTPNASEGEKYTTKYNPNSQMGRGLTAMAVNGMLPTPTAGDYQSPGKHGEGSPDLRTAVSFQTGTTFRLNPLFVAEMMGFPVSWTLLPFLKDEEPGNHTSHMDDGEKSQSKDSAMR